MASTSPNPFLATVSAVRIARPTTDLKKVVRFYQDDLGFLRVGVP